MDKLDLILGIIRIDAEKKRDNAAQGGEYGDGGASALEDQILIYKCGLSGKFPSKWEKYRKEYENSIDPEYQEYLKLKEKFE